MGVPGLWERLEEASSGDVSLANMAWTTYNPKRPDKMLRIGVDASIWLVQTATVALPQYPHHALQILFHKLAKLLALPVRLLFVFDGADRPNIKRGKRISGARAIGEEKNFRKMIEAFGYEHWTAPGEAEAELGYLSHTGSLDLVISEDVDSLIFKTKRLLLRTKLESTKADALRFKIFYKDEIEEKLQIDESALILVALMSGGDYDEAGLMRCGPKVSFALGQAGFGHKLVTAYKTQRRVDFVDDFLPAFRVSVADALRRNPDNLLGRRFMKLADSITDAFPDLDVLDYYVNPLTSASRSAKWAGFASVVGRPDVGRLGQLMQGWQEWDERDVLAKFRTTVWEGLLARSLMEEVVQPGIWDLRYRDKLANPLNAVLAAPAPAASSRVTDFFVASKQPSASGTASSSKAGAVAGSSKSGAARPFDGSSRTLVTAVSRFRKHASTDELLEYRVTVDPVAFVGEVHGARLAKDIAKSYEPPSDSLDGWSGSEGDSQPSSQAAAAARKKTPTDPAEPCLFWVPYRLLKVSHPDLVADFNAREEDKVRKKQEKLQRAEDKANGVVRPRKSPAKKKTAAAAAPVKGKSKGKARAGHSYSDLSDSDDVYADSIKRDLAKLSPSKSSGQSVAPASSTASFPDLGPSVAPKPKPKPRPPSKKPAYVELSDSDDDPCRATPRALPALPEESAATAKRPVRRRAVSDSPSGPGSVAEVDDSSGNPSPKKSPRKSRVQARPPARARADLSSDSDSDDADFPADPFAADKARRAAASSSSSKGKERAVPRALGAAPSGSLVLDLSPEKPTGSQTVLSSPLKKLDLLTPAGRPKSTTPAAADPAVDIIEIGSSPPPAAVAPKPPRARSKTADAPPGKGKPADGALGRKKSNPWSKSRRAGSASTTGGAPDEVIDLTDD